MSYPIRLIAFCLGGILCGLAVVANYPIESMAAWIPGVLLILCAIFTR